MTDKPQLEPMKPLEPQTGPQMEIDRDLPIPEKPKANKERTMQAPRRNFDHLTNYDFNVEIEGITVGPFKEVEGLGSSSEVTTYRDGGDNLERKVAKKTHYSNIILRRGFTGSLDLFEWRVKVTQGIIERKSGSIILLDTAQNEILRFNFFEAWPCRWNLSKLSTEDDGVLTEEIELIIEKFERA